MEMLIFLQTFCKIHLDSMLQPQNCQVLCASWFYTTCPAVVWMSELRKRKRVKLPHKTSSIKEDHFLAPVRLAAKILFVNYSKI